MPLVKAQCSNCGGMLEVDSSTGTAVCPFCNTPYVMENVYNINVEPEHGRNLVVGWVIILIATLITILLTVLTARLDILVISSIIIFSIACLLKYLETI